MRMIWLAVSVFVATASGLHAQGADGAAGVRVFNAAMTDATRRMDNAATLALWDDAGVSLLPATAPIAGKAAIAKFFGDVTAQLKGARMESFDMSCADIEVSGAWASEWCTEHQVVSFPDGQPKFDGRGRMLLVLHRGADDRWKLRAEMWQPAPAADSASHSLR